MRVFVAGGTGVIGRSLVPMLIAAGHQVTASTRSTGKAGLLRSLLMTQIRGPANAKAGRELGWAPRYVSRRDGFAAGLGGDDHHSERAVAGVNADGRA